MTKPPKIFPAACGGREGFISCRPSYKVRWQNCTAYTLSHKLFRCSGEAPRGPIKAQHSTVSVVPLIIPFTNIFWKVKQKFRNSCDLKILTVSCFFLQQISIVFSLYHHSKGCQVCSVSRRSPPINATTVHILLSLYTIICVSPTQVAENRIDICSVKRRMLEDHIGSARREAAGGKFLGF